MGEAEIAGEGTGETAAPGERARATRRSRKTCATFKLYPSWLVSPRLAVHQLLTTVELFLRSGINEGSGFNLSHFC